MNTCLSLEYDLDETTRKDFWNGAYVTSEASDVSWLIMSMTGEIT